MYITDYLIEVWYKTSMAKEDKTAPRDRFRKGVSSPGGVGGAVYGLGFFGALVYFIQHASSFLDGVIGVLKAFIWPALLVYKALEFLKL